VVGAAPIRLDDPNFLAHPGLPCRGSVRILVGETNGRLSVSEQMAQLPTGIELCFETFGDPGDAPLVLIMGLGGPMGWWSLDFCHKLVGRGFFVIRYDNRDVGHSTRVHTDRPVVRRQLVSTYLGKRRHAPYSIFDLASDAVGLLDHLGVERSHVVGVSMGGMVAQTVAIEHPERVSSLTSIMASTGRRNVGWAHPRLLPMLFAPVATTKEEYVTRTAMGTAMIGSARYPRDEAVMRALAEETWDRGYSPEGALRQLLAVLTQPDRTRALRGLDVPACVVHGLADRLVHASGGRATARAIRGAELVLVPDMAHDLPPQLDDVVADAIQRTAARAGTDQPAANPATNNPATIRDF